MNVSDFEVGKVRELEF